MHLCEPVCLGRQLPSKDILSQLQVLTDSDVGATLDVVCGAPAEPSLLTVSKVWDSTTPVYSLLLVHM